MRMHMKVECPPLLVFNEFASSLLQHCINFIVFFHTEIIRCRIGVEAVSIKHKLNSFDVHALTLAKSFHELQREQRANTKNAPLRASATGRNRAL